MSISDDRLMAYADGELDPPEWAAERSAIEAAALTDPAIARRIEQHRALRVRLGTLYGELLHEPVPERLVTGRVRASNTAGLVSRPWGAMAASLVVGVVATWVALTLRGSGPISVGDGRMLAQSSLYRALNLQLAGEPVRVGAARVGLSFKSKAGGYCRTFFLAGRAPLGGLACREGEAWHIDVLARIETPAGSELPAAVRAAVGAQIAGDPLDAQGEIKARQNHWK